MSRQLVKPPEDRNDGTGQRDRTLLALDPAQVRIDDRSSADLLDYVMKLVKHLRFFGTSADCQSVEDMGTTWADFANPPQGMEATAADIIGWMRNPQALDEARRQWLGRPHFALLLAFIELLGQAREHMNSLTERHLDYHFRDLLGMRPEPAEPDRVAVLLRLAARAPTTVLRAGTELDGDRDSLGQTRVYRTERDVLVNQAEVAELRSVYIDRPPLGIPDVRQDSSLPVEDAVNLMLRLAWGEPDPGDAIPLWRRQPTDPGQLIDHAWLVDPSPDGLGAVLALASVDSGLYLAQHELRTLMRLLARREAGIEWPEINRLLGLSALADPRDFATNLAAAIAPEVIDFNNDKLPQVATIDDLYARSDEPAVQDYIRRKLARLATNGVKPVERFRDIMQLKQAVDRDWASINNLLDLIDQRRPKQANRPEPGDLPQTDFDGRLAKALDSDMPVWPWGTGSLAGYERLMRELELQFGLSVENLALLVQSIQALPHRQPEDPAWEEVDRLLAEAHRQRVYTRRPLVLDALRRGRGPVVAFDAMVAQVLSPLRKQGAAPPSWSQASVQLGKAGRVTPKSLADLEAFRAALAEPTSPPAGLTWPEVIELLERAWRVMDQPIALLPQWRHLYAWPDARLVLDDPTSSPRWKFFGRVDGSAQAAAAPNVGWLLRSPLLQLAGGQRTITATLGFEDSSFDRGRILRHLGLEGPAALREADIQAALSQALIIELSTSKGWLQPVVKCITLRAGAPGDDYWKAIGQQRPETATNRPALQFELDLPPELAAVSSGPGQTEACLRFLLRPMRAADDAPWTTRYLAFEALRLQGIHLEVSVTGLRQLQVQAEDLPLDARKPIEPFGHRPLQGARLYVSHPEIVRKRLDTLTFTGQWVGLPAANHYAGYAVVAKAAVPPAVPAPTTAPTPQTGLDLQAALVDRQVPFAFAPSLYAFGSTDGWVHQPNISAALAARQEFVYASQPELQPTRDLRDADRYWQLELQSNLGHLDYPNLVSSKAAQMVLDLRKSPVPERAEGYYQVNAPYVPVLRDLAVNYTAHVEWSPGGQPNADSTQAAGGELLHHHPFGTAKVRTTLPPLEPVPPPLLPQYLGEGELYIGLKGLAPPSHLHLLVQLAEGSADPDLAPADVGWSCLDGDEWRAVDIVDDGTRGLRHSGIVELALPAVKPSSLLPAELYWLRVDVPDRSAAVCDAINMHTQAVIAVLDDKPYAPDHYGVPLPAGKIKRLMQADSRIAAVVQPYTSFGARMAEAPELFRRRASERLRHRQRAVTPWDVERIVLQRFPKIYKVKCLRASPGPGDMTVIVVPDIRNVRPADVFNPRAAAWLLDDIEAHLRERSPAGSKIYVRNARFVPVSVRVSVRFMPEQDEQHAVTRLNQDLKHFLAPWAHDDAADIIIGNRIHANSIIDFIDRRDYVDYVASIKLFRIRANRDKELILPPGGSAGDYVIKPEQPDEVLVSADVHDIDIIPPGGYNPADFSGINYMKVELDFIVRA